MNKDLDNKAGIAGACIITGALLVSAAFVIISEARAIKSDNIDKNQTELDSGLSQQEINAKQLTVYHFKSDGVKCVSFNQRQIECWKVEK